MKLDFKMLKDEIRGILLAFAIVLVILKLVFYKESFIVVFRLVVGLFWILVLPGWAFMLYWRGQLGFVERLIIGTGVGSGILGVASYYIAIWGFDVAGHGWLPLVLIIVGLALYHKSNNHQKKED